MLRPFGGSFIDALIASFPELSFDKSKFPQVPRMFSHLNTLISQLIKVTTGQTHKTSKRGLTVLQERRVLILILQLTGTRSHVRISSMQRYEYFFVLVCFANKL